MPPLTSAAKSLWGFYIFIAALDLLFLFLQRQDLRWYSKPLLMPVLMLAFYLCAPRQRNVFFYLIFAALFLSWCGDVFLQANDLFIPGLTAFLLAHIAYIFYFRLAVKTQTKHSSLRPVFILMVLFYISILLIFLLPHLGELKLPVILYSLTIGTMLLMAINTRDKMALSASNFFLMGALLFVLSDSLLAINLFAIQSPVFGPFVMATYATAQYLIVKGALVYAGTSGSQKSPG